MKFIILLCLSILIFTLKIYSTPSSPSQSPLPFVVRGNEMLYEPKKNESQVIGDAYAERVFPSSPPRCQVLKAQTFHIYFQAKNNKDSSSSNPQNIHSIKANGEVTFTDQDLSIKADTCVYYAESLNEESQTAGRIVCTQNVTLRKGDHTLKGGKAEANLQEGTYKVTPLNPSNKVEAVLSPSQNSSKKIS